jgi:hypothetical protein
MKYAQVAAVAALAHLTSTFAKPLQRRQYGKPMVYGFDGVRYLIARAELLAD